MPQILSEQPIGIFDSGVGGLTVANAITQLLPNENIIYFGDTAHLPYGDKSVAALQAYSIKICEMLLAQHCKLIVIACNTATSAAAELVREYVGSRAKIVNVIDPTIDYIHKHLPQKRIGLIGTRQTVNSNIYKKKIDAFNNGTELFALATPLLVHMIEEGYSHKRIVSEIITDYLNDEVLSNIDALILGCTHYPLIKSEIAAFYQQPIILVDAAETTAKAVKHLLELHHLTNDRALNHHKFYVSDYTESFSTTAKLFFTEAVQLEHYPLWD